MNAVSQNGNVIPPKDETSGQTPQQEKVQYEYLWITDEGLLRDEGTLFGIAGAPSEEKVSAIRAYFNTKKAVSLQKKENLELEVKKNDDLIAYLEKEIKEKDVILANLTKERKSYNLLPILFQLIGYLCICYFNYYLVSHWLAPGNFSQFICLGLYLFGLLSVFLGRSIMYNSTIDITCEKEEIKREKWKVYLEEFGIPIVVSAFICILTFRFYPIEYSIGIFALLLFLFLFSGKGLINLQFRFRKEFANYIFEAAGRRNIRKEKRELSKQKKGIEDLLTGIRKNAQDPLSALKTLEAEEAYKIHVFMSEYNLARESRSSFDDNQLKKFA